MIRSWLIWGVLVSSLWSLEHLRLAPERYDDSKMEILDSVVLSLSRIDGIDFRDISALAYDSDRDLLYMLGDKGALFAMRPKIKKGRIEALEPVWGKYLRSKEGRRLLKPYRDSEGMAILRDKERKALLISFEHTPRIALLGTDAKVKKRFDLPSPLRPKYAYQGRNRMLEGVTVDPVYGIVTAPELPLRSQKRGYHGIYGPKGMICMIPSSEGYSITELESIGKREMVILERRLDMTHFGFDIRLRKVFLKPQKGVCPTLKLLEMKKSGGWRTDNFEGLCRYRGDLFLMISDDNANPFQRTILTLFRLR